VVVEVDIGASIFNTEAQLVFAHRPGDGVGKLAGNIIPARGGRDADRVESVDRDLRGAGQTGARVEPSQLQGILVVHRVGKVLRKVVHAGGQLVRQIRTKAEV